MLYLIKQEGKEQNYLKIGYTKNIEERLKAYNTHNANFKLIETIENADISIETFAHNLLEKFKYKGEWYTESNEVYLIWEICKQETRLRINEQKISQLEKDYQQLEKEISFYKKELERLLSI